MKKRFFTTSLILSLLVAFSITAFAQDAIEVNVGNYVRAESDYQIQRYAKTLGCFGKLVHQRDFYSVDNQLTVRVNRDTYYSFGIYDLTSASQIRVFDFSR